MHLALTFCSTHVSIGRYPLRAPNPLGHPPSFVLATALGVLEDLVDVGGSTPKLVEQVRSIGHESPGGCVDTPLVDRRHVVLRYKSDNRLSLRDKHGALHDNETIHLRTRHVCERLLEW